MSRIAFSLIPFVACVPLSGVALDLASPDEAVRFTLLNSGGRLTYSVTAFGQQRLAPDSLGVIVDGENLGASAKPGEPGMKKISETFAWRGNKTTGTNLCNAYEVPIRSGKGNDWILEVRVFNDGAGFRYRIPGSGTRRITGEATSWQVPPKSTLWYQTDTSNYEGPYHSSQADAVPLEEEIKKQKRATHLGPPVTVAYEDGAFGLISEAALYKYSGLTLRPEGEAKFRAAFQDDPDGWSHQGEILSPWRVIILSKDLNGIVNSDLIPALCEAPDPKLFPEGMNTAWIRPGKAPCTWMVYGNDGAQWDKQKWFVDLCARTGCEYLLVDAGWRSEKWGWMKGGADVWARAKELCAYAAQKEVGIILWHAYPEGRDDSPGLTSVEAREELFSKCREAGVKGVKIDFFDSESAEVIQAYEDLLRRSAQHQIMINFHGANKPTGEPRTWPHEITREGIREQEYVLWSSLPLAHYGALPFTRMAAGHADFLPGYVQQRFLKTTSATFQVATVLVFSSPFLCWPDNPEAYLNHALLPFFRSVPVTWDETRILPGSVIGETVIMARRKGDSWYVAALNCRQEARDIEMDLSGLNLAAKEMTTYSDALEGTGIQIATAQKPPGNGRLKISFRPGGGFVAQFHTPKTYPGWR